MKYIIACLLSFGIISGAMAQDYEDENDENYPSVDSYKNDHLNPNQVNNKDKMNSVFSGTSAIQDQKDEMPVGDINKHLPMPASSGGAAVLVGILGGTEFGKTCMMKKREGVEQPENTSAGVFKIKDKNLKMEKKASGEERIKFHNENEFLVYHRKKNARSHYTYLYKEGNSLLRMEKHKKGDGYVILASGNFENELPAMLMEQGAPAVQRDLNSCMR